MKSLIKKIICSMLAISLLIGSNISFAVNQEQLNSQKESNNQKINEVESEKEKVQEIKDETVKEVAKLDEQIDEYQSQINSLDSEISELNTKIDDSNKKLEKAQKDFEKQQEMLEERVVALYEAGDTTYLDVLLSADSVSEFISSYYIVSEIAECDLDLLNEIDRQKTEIENAKKELEESKNQLTVAKSSKEEVSTQLQSTKNEKSKYVDQLSEQEKDLQAQIDEIKRDNVAIDQQIRAYQAQIEKMRQEEAARRAQQSSSNSSGSSSGGASSAPSSSSSSSGFIYPVPSAYSRVTTGWYYSDGRVHGAIDFGSGGINGQPVYCVADGYVVLTAALTTSYGNYVLIAHDNGLYTLYAHGQAGSICVSQFQRVKQGQQIMRVGSTGNSSGPHLHFEVRTAPGEYANRKNPLNYL